MVEFLKSRLVVRKKLATTNLWEAEDDGIVIKDFSDPKVSVNVGKKRDAFSFKVFSPNNALYETYLSGDSSTTDFTLQFSPIPSEHLSGTTQKFNVYVEGELKNYVTDYSVSGDTISFTSAPASGDRNIRIEYPVVETDDLVDIYLWSNSSFDNLTQEEKDQARRIEGTITEPTLDRVTNMVSVRGFGIIDSVFAGMAFALAPTTDDLAHKVIQSIISQLNKFNPNRRIYGQDATEWADIGNTETTESITYTNKYRTAIEMIEELSGDKNTGDGQFIYYLQYNPRSSTATSTSSGKLVDTNASFVSTLAGLTIYNNTDKTTATITSVDSSTELSLSSDIFSSGDDYSLPTYDFTWKAKSTTATGAVIEGVNPSTIKVGKAVDGVVNVVIYNAGLDPYGNGMEFLNYDYTITGFGSRWKYVSATSTIGGDLVKNEFEADTSKWDTTSDDNRVGNFPKAASYPYTLQFEDRDSSGVKTGSQAIASSDNEFNDLIRQEAKWQGKGRTDQLIRRFSNPRYKATLFLPYSSADQYVMGEIYALDIPSFGLETKSMRLNQIDYEFWGVQLQFEEDEVTILEGGI